MIGLFLSDSFFHALKELQGVILEKVELHHNGDAEQQLGIQRWPFEELIDMVAGARDLPRKPAHAALVFLQLFLDELTDVDVVHFFNSLSVQQKY